MEQVASWNPAVPVVAVRTRLESVLTRVAGLRWWTWWTALISFSLGVMLAAVDPRGVKWTSQWTFIVEHSRGPLFDSDVSPMSRNANLTFRIVPRMAGHLLHFTQPWHFYVAQVLLGLVLFVVIARVFEEALGDRVTAMVSTIGTTGLWAVASAWVEVRGNFDALAILLLLTAMLVRRPPLILLAALAATFTDERALFALPIVAVWHLLREEDPAAPRRPWAALPKVAPLAAIAAGFCHAAIRVLLSRRYGLVEGENHSPGDPWTQLNNYPNGFWGALEGYWLAVAAGMIALVRSGWRLLVVLTLAVMAFILLVGFSVFDISRSVMYVFPVVPVAFLGLRGVDAAWKRSMAWVVATISLVWPILYAGDVRIVNWVYPLPLLVVDMLGLT